MELLEIAKSILTANKRCSLSGSLGLEAQGVKIRRPVKDIDIYLPLGIEFEKIEGMRVSTKDGDNEDYDPEGWIREGYVFGGIQIDVFTPENELTTEPEITDHNGMSIVKTADIIKFKIEHAFGEHWTRFKHRDDIIHILVNNII